ncbi:LCP family protein [Haloechinothrix sp. LS1_15]|uniref:LCP family protein n=1 Tax=Haloechinothrix sp. LS1_15 TaxID=2652248 RepID=UPI0029475CDA|nr:LCP family protein [Haloechinothrix sp. LS1_15]MDV6013200.1 LytR family transcriptional regulator [Haloechinothrix sp. LS1_15]
MSFRGHDDGRSRAQRGWQRGGRREHQATRMMPLPGGGNRPAGRARSSQATARQPHRPPVKPRPARRKRSRMPRVLGALAAVFLLLLAAAWIYVDLSLDRTEAITDYEGRPAAAAGTNWLIVGSDSREGLDAEDRARLATGDDGGEVADTIMLAHIPDNDTKPTLMSVPRDLRVDIPGHGSGRANAAYSLGGPTALVRSVEQLTQLRIDHYVEIGFAGFESIVDAMGGVEMTIESDMHDTRTGRTVEAGERKLSGEEALHFVRMRYSDATPRSDLDRISNQREFLGALASQAASPGTLLNPFRAVPLMHAGPQALTVDDSDRLHHLVRLAWAMRGISDGGVVTTTIPVATAAAAELDHARAERMFEALRTDQPVPEDLVFE